MGREIGLTYQVCDGCKEKIIHGAKFMPDDWGQIVTYGNDGGGSGHVMASWDFCPKCVALLLEKVFQKEPA